MTLKQAYVHGIAIATQAVGYLVAFGFNFGADQKILISVGGIVISAGIVLADAVKNKPASESDVQAIKTAVESAASQVDFTPAIRAEIVKLLGTTTTAKSPLS